MTAPATPEELFVDAYDEARRMARGIVAKWYRGCRPNRWDDDAQSAAMEVLWRCALRFDASRGAPFRHYWPKAIQGAMVDELRRLHPGSKGEHPPSYRVFEDGDDGADDRTPEDIVVANIAMDELEAAVASLPRDLRVAIDGCREGSTQRAVAKAEGVTGSAITLRKIVARRMLVGRLRVA